MAAGFLLPFIELAVLDPLATRHDCDRAARLAADYQCAGLCSWAGLLPLGRQVRHRFRNAGCCYTAVVGYPTGKHASLVKATEARYAAEQGADRVELAVDMAVLAAGDYSAVLSELVLARQGVDTDVQVGVVVDAAVLAAGQVGGLVEVCVSAGVDYIVVSLAPGWWTHGQAFCGGQACYTRVVECVQHISAELTRAGAAAQLGCGGSPGVIGVKAQYAARMPEHGGLAGWVVDCFHAGATCVAIPDVQVLDQLA